MTSLRRIFRDTGKALREQPRLFKSRSSENEGNAYITVQNDSVLKTWNLARSTKSIPSHVDLQRPAFTVTCPSVKSSSDSAMSSSDSEGEGGANDKLPPALRADPNAKIYTYRDFASVTEEPDEPEDESENHKRGNSDRSIRIQKFPVKLYAILARQEFSDIIAWMPHGRSWKVLKPNAFETLVMPLFFEYSNYHSFNRLVNAWSFRRLSTGPDRGAYYHEVSVMSETTVEITGIASVVSQACLVSLTRFSIANFSALLAWKTSFAKVHASSSKDSQEAAHQEI